jgi:hypothetical protein
MKERYLPFAERFIAQFAPEIVKAYLGTVQRIVEGEWQSAKTKHYILSFFEDWLEVRRPDQPSLDHSIKPKATWSLIKPHILPLVQSFVFPLICLTDDEVEQFSEDPQEFARTHFGGERLHIDSVFVYGELIDEASPLRLHSRLVRLPLRLCAKLHRHSGRASHRPRPQAHP